LVADFPDDELHLAENLEVVLWESLMDWNPYWTYPKFE
jgi:hypothetical protein